MPSLSRNCPLELKTHNNMCFKAICPPKNLDASLRIFANQITKQGFEEKSENRCASMSKLEKFTAGLGAAAFPGTVIIRFQRLLGFYTE